MIYFCRGSGASGGGFCERIPQVRAHPVRQATEFSDDFGMLIGNIRRFTDIFVEVIQFEAGLVVFVVHGNAARTSSATGERAVGMREHEFPFSAPHSLELVSLVVEEECLVG